MQEEQTNRLPWIKKFFLVCSGCDLEILTRPECRVEVNKYVGIGATIFSTALLATLSGGYALFTVFHSVPMAIGFGLVWGCIIFNLDRYIVSTIRKNSTPELTFREQIQWRLREFGHFAPRLLLAVFISIVITRPIELRLFQSEINKALDTQTSADLGRLREQSTAEFPDIARLTTENENLRTEINNKKTQVDGLYELAIAEGMGEQRGNTTGRSGKGPFYRERLEAYEREQRVFVDLKKTNEDRIAANDIVIADLRRQQIERERGRVPTVRENGLIARLTTLSDLAEAHSSVRLTSWFLMVLFILLETAPIFVKILSERGPYDEIYETLEHDVWVREQKKRLEINTELETDLALVDRIRAETLAAKLELSRRTMDKIDGFAGPQLAEAQARISKSLVEEWLKTHLDTQQNKSRSSTFGSNGNARQHAPDPEPHTATPI
ncbi:MAG TPA: DUF4407 domain-containing protein [Pyrinomonadaceae bacterium]|nr:DUF4407 domain-containing protein [Pyrinomonadaceae bacterium]